MVTCVAGYVRTGLSSRGGSPGEDAVFRLLSPPSSPSRAGGTQLGDEEGRMKEWGVTRASRRQGNGSPASHVRCHTRCGHELLRAPTCCARARRRSEGPTPRGTASVARSRSAHSSRAVSRAAPSYLRLRAPPFSAPSFIFTFFPSSFFITGGAACTGGASTASLPANHHLAVSLLAEPPRAVANGL